MGRIIAIDYGTKRTGIAATDPQRIIASGLTTLQTSKVLEFLESYILKETVDCIVVGEPKQMDNSASRVEEQIGPFVKALKKKFPKVTIERMDERFTSKMAFRAMIEAGLNKKQRQNKETVDMVSATIILQSYMEKIEYGTK